ncbi:hypothetical protein PHJA_002710400 [Phtheirospermum japonicum]|uniref:Isopenicillin N synthase-like Fe(2+) 2OG dioxygenase domain-containing protein n=1 Tax=Phtheirospermum japonicum TaxID=374723 RepID=A0A830D4W3_9LAMI|nr:hypothetical protein PHJA_002710400 [Phtheirospermum japonicum]
MEGLWPFGYSNFSQEMEKLHGEIEEVGSKILQFLEQHSTKRPWPENNSPEAAKFCYIQKHSRKTEDESLRYDVIRMLIRGSEFAHALCLHVCSGSTDFHVYSKKGWLSFCPTQHSILITIGDKLQAWSGGQYKHVIGRPVFKGKDERCISMGFLFSPPNLKNSIKDDKVVTISLNQQIIFALLITIIYQVLIFIYYFLFKRQK